MRDDMNVFTKQHKLCPQTGLFITVYKTFYLIHKIVLAFYLPIVVAFFRVPGITMVMFDIYFDFIFLIEIVSTFFTALIDKDMKLVTDRKRIARNYICGTFIFDVVACVPYSALHLQS
jgi:hypothetical protein